ncbi:MAG: molybdopterin converting factor subunit 1 [Planctomyces sp.]|nr:molybdopterin converting factor subunit 1 [Planctomyces sp.]
MVNVHPELRPFQRPSAMPAPDSIRPVPVDVQLFALAKELTGQALIQVAVTGEPVTIGSLRKSLVLQFPQLAPLEKRLLFAVGTQYATDDTVIDGRQSVACFPPVSGG